MLYAGLNANINVTIIVHEQTFSMSLTLKLTTLLLTLLTFSLQSANIFWRSERMVLTPAKNGVLTIIETIESESNFVERED